MSRSNRIVQFTLDELKERIDNYFNKCDEELEPYTVTGLCLALNVTRQTLINYENRDRSFINMSEEEIEEFVGTVKRAKLRIENYAEKQLFSARNPAGIIFNLKNNYGWKDIQEVNSNVNNTSNPLQELSTEELRELLNEPVKD